MKKFKIVTESINKFIKKDNKNQILFQNKNISKKKLVSMKNHWKTLDMKMKTS